jgi:uncharacterized membrane protein YdbT with pleckstrin-like domain
MPYVDTLLTSDETILYRTKKHWIAPVLATVPGAALTVGGLALMIITMLLDPSWFRTGMLWASLALLLVGLAILGTSYMHWLTQEYVVTNQKVIKAEGWLRKRSEGASLEKINEIEMEQTLIGRSLNFGTLKVRTASDEADLRYWMMRSPAEFRKQILEAKQALERADAMYIADAVHSAARGSDGPAPEPAPAVAEQTGAVPTVDPTQIPAMIQQLAALRDSGAITATEFEAKKADLLNRM